MALRKNKISKEEKKGSKTLDKIEFMKKAFFFLLESRRWLKEIYYLFRREIEERRRLFYRSIVYYSLGAGLLITGVFFTGLSLFFLLEKYFNDPLIAASAVALGLIVLSVFFLVIGNSALKKLFSIDREKLKKNFLD